MYSPSGNLRTFLQENHSRISWNEKLKLCSDLANGIKYIHSFGIMHFALHPNNIIYHNSRLLISDLGISKVHITPSLQYLDTLKTSLILPYHDPKYLIDPMNFQRDKSSDIYTLGYRPQPTVDTPYDYVMLYKDCWKMEPTSRSNIEEKSDLKIMGEYNDNINNNKEKMMEKEKDIINEDGGTKSSKSIYFSLDTTTTTYPTMSLNNNILIDEEV
ncbi:11541_t:CDS:2 [Diversispora eburnea]|uniref:11541_t:CDS:1 n=1 Tax=Diversispora eburnea TaxID=1213867 RepID=A0A9N8ZNE9_9GLOM|nr:11541_t:CDS:2 [Diversispora eburnea]